MKYPTGITGIIHGGAHLAEEFDEYMSRGVTHTMWIEPQPEKCSEVRRMFGARQDLDAVSVDIRQVALGATSHRQRFLRASNGQSSSLLKPTGHLSEHPEISFTLSDDNVLVTPLDDIAFSRALYQMLVLDVQGYELEALKGATETLKSLRAVQCEIATKEMYLGGVLFPELREFMETQGFRMSEHFLWPNSCEGEALWVRK